MSQQLRLLPPPKPLTERFGAAFFRGIPKLPGVYRMFGERDELLYVGQSANLHDRLGGYRHVHPDRDSRKTVRLVHRVRRIAWEVCDSPVSAVLRENELLRTLRPPFNRMNVYPQACRFIAVSREDKAVCLALTRDMETEGTLYGAFKGAAPAFAALVRLLFVMSHPAAALQSFPARLLTGDRLRQMKVPMPEALEASVRRYLTGESDELIAHMTETCAAARFATLFEQNLLLADLLMLDEFFVTGPARLRRMRQQVESKTDWVRPEIMVDWLATEKFAAGTAPGTNNRRRPKPHPNQMRDHDERACVRCDSAIV